MAYVIGDAGIDAGNESRGGVLLVAVVAVTGWVLFKELSRVSARERRYRQNRK